MKAHWVSVGHTMPAAETPIEVQPSACPRLVTNHLETVTGGDEGSQPSQRR